MQQPTEPLARELARAVRDLKARLGARRLAGSLPAPDPAPAPPHGDLLPLAGEAAAAVDVAEVDLLWPPGRPQNTAGLAARCGEDLDLEKVVAALALDADRDHREHLRRTLHTLCLDPETIVYRQAILEDLLGQPPLVAGLEELLPRIEQLGLYSMTNKDMPELFQVTWWLGELETYVDCVQAAGRTLDEVGADLRSAGLRQMRDLLVAARQDPAFDSLVRELPGLLATIRGVLSITIGVNLDPELRPVEATLLSVNDQRFTGSPLLRTLLGGNASEFETVMPLHGVPGAAGAGGVSAMAGKRPNPLMVPLLRDLSRVMEQVSRPIAEALGRYVHLNRRLLAGLAPALAFYVGAARLVRRLEAAGLPTCRPELAPLDERVCDVADGYNLGLALHLLDRGEADLRPGIVCNDVDLGSKARIAILTGPNRGGKTTYTQSAGLIQVLAQVGLHVPARRARLSPADDVHTHFPVEEELTSGTGRFGDEAQRLREIFGRATRHSLILLNESLSGTYAGESLYLARDVIRVCRRLGARVILATHLHELAAQVDELNAESPGESRVVSLVSSRIDAETLRQGSTEIATRRTYRVLPGPPMGRSYARELAAQYGIGFEELLALLAERGVLPDNDRL